MKSKAIFLAAVLVMMPFVLHAQWRVGALGGLDYNIHSQDVHYMTDYSVHGGLGFDGGISGQYSFNKWLVKCRKFDSRMGVKIMNLEIKK